MTSRAKRSRVEGGTDASIENETVDDHDDEKETMKSIEVEGGDEESYGEEMPGKGMRCSSCEEKKKRLRCVFVGSYKWGTGEMVCDKCVKKDDNVVYGFYHGGRYLWYDNEWFYRFGNPHGDYRFLPFREESITYDELHANPDYGEIANSIDQILEEEYEKECRSDRKTKRIVKKK
jgi:hypothetical protein